MDTMQPDYQLATAYLEIRNLVGRIDTLERARLDGQVTNLRETVQRLNGELYHYSRQVDTLGYQVEQLTTLLQQRFRLTLADDGTITVQERDR